MNAATHDLDVLAFGAHPDDVELGCGGTMLRFADAGLRTGVIDLTAGERGSRGDAATRAEEARASSALLRLVVRETLSFPDTELVADIAVRRAAVAAIRRHRPRIVLAPLPHDLHPDHAAAGCAVRDAMYASGMRNFDAPGDPWRPQRLFHYFMHDEAETTVVVDVSDVWERRLDVARCFASQLHVSAAPATSPTTAPTSSPTTDGAAAFPTLISRPDFLLRIEARARVWGRRAGVDLGEPLVVGGALPVADMAALFAAGRS